MINLSDKIQLDIQNKSISLTTLVLIDIVRDELGNITNDPVYISTNKGVFDGTTFWEDRALKISSVKESIDLINRKFKINKLSFSLNNSPVNGTRFSDFVAERDLLNKTVEVYYKTQSCINLSDCVLVYKGNIRRLDHDSKSVKIQLEDLTEDKLSKKIPIANTGHKASVYNKNDLNTPIPILYGKVEKAPLITLLEERPLSGETSLNLIPDDVMGDRGIEVTDFFGDSSTQSLSNNLNPLYIYKDDYFQALEVYNHDVIDDPPDDNGNQNWVWTHYNQYNVRDNYIEILKQYTGVTALNPPADNEIQCIKKRFPNDMKIVPNPAGLSEADLEEVGGYVDAIGTGVVFDDPFIKSPEASYDNPNVSQGKSRNWYVPNTNTSYNNTSAESPDQTIDYSSDWNYQVKDFKPYREGIHNNNDARWQFEIAGWFQRYAHNFNNEIIDGELHISEDPSLLFIRMPSAEYLRQRVNMKLLQMLDNAIPEEISGDYSLMAYALSNGFPQFINNSECRVNSYPNICKPNANEWAEKCGNVTENAVSSFLDTNDATDLFLNGNNQSSYANGGFEKLAEDAFNENEKINYPNFCVQLELEYWDADSNPTTTASMLNMMKNLLAMDANGDTISFTNISDSVLINIWIQTFGDKRYVNISLENESRDEYEVGGTDSQDLSYSAFYFNFFQIEGQNHDYLYEKNDFPIYAPFMQQSKEANYRRIKPTYTCLWNGVSHGGAPDIVGGSVVNGVNISNTSPFFGWHALKGKNGSGNVYTNENDILPSSNSNNGWFVWMKDATEGRVGSDDSPTIQYESNNEAWGHVKTPANTLFAFSHIDKVNSSNHYESQGYNFDTGSQVTVDPSYTTLYKGDTIQKRLGFVFPFNEQGISSDIKTDTYFDGSVRLDFNRDETSNFPSYRQKVVLGAVDVSEDDIFIWSVFDNNADNEGAVLIDRTLQQCRIDPTQWYNSFDTDPTATNLIEDTHNSYDGNLLSVTNNFFEVNNYNSLALLYRVESADSDTNQVSQFVTNVHSISLVHYIVFEGAFDDKLYANVVGRANTMDDIVNINGIDEFKYTGASISPAGSFNTGDTDLDEFNFENQKSSISKPSDIIYHFVEKELNLIDSIDVDSMKKARESSDMEFGFSTSNEVKGIDFVNELCKNCNLFPLFKSTSQFSLSLIKKTYSSADVNITIKSDEIIKYSFTRTPVEKIHTMVNVKYKMDYAEDELMEETGYVDGYDMFGNMDDNNRSGSWNPQILGGSAEIEFKGYSYDYLGIDIEDKVFNFESNFIRDIDSAKQLRDFIYMWNCNQRNIFKLTLPLKYLALEVGDIVSFNSLIDNMKAYGEDYTTTNTRNGQEIYPFFIVHSVDKKQKNINIEITQLHNLQPNFSAYIGSVTRTRGIKNGQHEAFSLTMNDSDILLDFLYNGQPYYTENQKRVSDINENGYIDDSDHLALEQLLVNGEFLFGDVSGDGVVNVMDIVALISAITGGDEANEMLEQMDLSGDGIVNVIDIIAMINIIIGNVE